MVENDKEMSGITNNCNFCNKKTLYLIPYVFQPSAGGSMTGLICIRCMKNELLRDKSVYL